MIRIAHLSLFELPVAFEVCADGVVLFDVVLFGAVEVDGEELDAAEVVATWARMEFPFDSAGSFRLVGIFSFTLSSFFASSNELMSCVIGFELRPSSPSVSVVSCPSRMPIGSIPFGVRPFR